MTNAFAAKNLPDRVTARSDDVDGLPPFRARDLRGKVGSVLGAFMYSFGDGSTEPCFTVMLPSGDVLNVAMVRCRVVEPAEFGEWERTGRLNS